MGLQGDVGVGVALVLFRMSPFQKVDETSAASVTRTDLAELEQLYEPVGLDHDALNNNGNDESLLSV